MSTHKKVRDALDRAVNAHRNAHRDHLAQAGLEEFTEAAMPAPTYQGTDPPPGLDHDD